jgi:UDP-N-acetylmuramate--alanine ligase
VDDYGHHPVEIRATLAAAAEGFEGRRLIAVFQPHRYSRVQDLQEDFCGAFNAASQVLVCPIYAAGEAPIPGVSAEGIVEGLRERGHRGVSAVADLEGAIERLVEIVRPGDVVITLGAGDVNRICSPLADRLRALGAAGA